MRPWSNSLLCGKQLSTHVHTVPAVLYDVPDVCCVFQTSHSLIPLILPSSPPPYPVSMCDS